MSFNLKSVSTLALCGAMIATASFAASHVSKSDAASVNVRHAQMQIISYHTGILGDMAKGEMEFDAEKAQAAATNLHAAAMMERATMWVEGTEQGAVEGSRAKAEIWTDAEGFDAAFTKLQEASAALMEVSDLDAVKAGMNDVGKSCGGCHDDYRGPKN